jgi:DNA polymerase I
MPRVSSQPTLVGFDEPLGGEFAPVDALPPAAAQDCHPADEQPDLSGKTVYVVDSHSLIYQVFHALPEMSGPSGQPVGAVQGFVRDLLDLIEVRKADFLICAFDEGEITFRHDIYDQYKIHRDEMPADLQLQIPVIRRFLDALGILTLSIPGYEADDILATVAGQVEAAGGRCLLVTSDKDCRQLITDQVQLFNIRKQEVFDAAALQAAWGIRPDQVVDFQALVGDATDNIPGVAGIGPKGAQELLAKYGTLDEVLAHAGEVSGAKRRETLLASREIALTFNSAALADLCRECGIRQLARRIESLTVKFAPAPRSVVGAEPPAQQVEEPSTTPPQQQELIAEAAPPPSNLTTASSPEWKANYRTIATIEELQQLVLLLKQQRRIVLDTETTSLHARRAEMVGYSFAWAPGEACYIPVRAPAGEPQLDPAMSWTR